MGYTRKEWYHPHSLQHQNSLRENKSQIVVDQV